MDEATAARAVTVAAILVILGAFSAGVRGLVAAVVAIGFGTLIIL